VRCGKYVSRACTLDLAPVQVRDTFGVLLNRASLEVLSFLKTSEGRRPSNGHAEWSCGLGASDERPDLRIDPWTSASVSAPPGPIDLEALAMPADYGLWFHNDQGVVPVWPQAAEGDLECAVSLGQPGAFGLALQNDQLLSQGGVFEREFALRLQARSGGREQDVQQVKHRGRLD